MPRATWRWPMENKYIVRSSDSERGILEAVAADRLSERLQELIQSKAAGRVPGISWRATRSLHRSQHTVRLSDRNQVFLESEKQFRPGGPRHGTDEQLPRGLA